MLILESSPQQHTPNPLGQAAEWTINNPELRTVLPQRNTYILRFTGTGGNGQSIRVAGIDFQVDDSTPYTSSSFDHSQQAFLSAINAKNMLAANPAFRNYTVRTARPANGQPWRVIAVKTTASDATPDEGDNLDNGIQNATVEHIAGRTEVRQRQRMWYQFWSDNGPITEERFAPFDQAGKATVDGAEIARRLVGYQAPDPEGPALTFEFNSSRYISLRYGTYTSDGDCGTSFGQVFEAPPCPFINAVIQDTDTRGMQPYGPVREPGLLKWLTIRGTARTVPRGGYDWTSIYLGPSPYFAGASTWRLKREFFNEEGDSLGTIYDDINGGGVWRVATGGNGVPDNIGTAARYTVQVEAPLGFGWIGSSEELTVQLRDHSCAVAEVYYLEGLGSWRAIGFERREQETLAMTAQVWEQPEFEIGKPGAVLADGGGRSQRVVQSQDVFTLTTEPISERKRRAVKEMLESPAAYILEKDETGREMTRRLTFDRESYQVHGRGAVTRVSVSFTYARNRNNR